MRNKEGSAFTAFSYCTMAIAGLPCCRYRSPSRWSSCGDMSFVVLLTSSADGARPTFCRSRIRWYSPGLYVTWLFGLAQPPRKKTRAGRPTIKTPAPLTINLAFCTLTKSNVVVPVNMVRPLGILRHCPQTPSMYSGSRPGASETFCVASHTEIQPLSCKAFSPLERLDSWEAKRESRCLETQYTKVSWLASLSCPTSVGPPKGTSCHT